MKIPELIILILFWFLEFFVLLAEPWAIWNEICKSGLKIVHTNVKQRSGPHVFYVQVLIVWVLVGPVFQIISGCAIYLFSEKLVSDFDLLMWTMMLIPIQGLLLGLVWLWYQVLHIEIRFSDWLIAIVFLIPVFYTTYLYFN